MLDRRRVLIWLYRAWASTPIIVLFGSLAIGDLRSNQAPELPTIRDSIEALVGLGFSGLVCLPLVIGAAHLERHSHASGDQSRSWLIWLLLAPVLPLAFWMFLTYVFGALGMSIRPLATSLFERA